MSIRVPFNIYSIEDIDEWRKTFFYPLSSSVNEMVNERVCGFLLDDYQCLGNDFKVYFRIASKAIYIETYNLLMRLIMASSMRAYRDCEFVLTNGMVPKDVRLPARNITNELYKGAVDVPFPDLNLEYDDRYYRDTPFWKRVAKSMVGRYEAWRVRDRGEEDRALVIGPNECTLQYVRNRYNGTVRRALPEAIFKMPLGAGEGASCPLELEAFAGRLSNWVESVIHETTRNHVPVAILGSLRVAVRGLFGRIISDMEKARAFSRELPPKMKLYTGTAKHFVRVVSEAIREVGGTVTGFPHEGGLSGLQMPYLSFTEFATCDRFVCFHQDEAEDYRKYPTLNDVEFPVIPELGESIFSMEKVRLKRSATIDLKNVSTIMYVNLSYWHDSFTYGTRSDLQGLDLHLKVIEFLLTLGKRVVFKLRPKTAYLSKDYRHFDYFGDKVEYTAIPFTQVLRDADLFILEGVGSTALYEAMTMTETPIVLLKADNPKCTAQFEEMLRTRCFVVDLFEDSRNRLRFKETELKEIFGR